MSKLVIVLGTQNEKKRSELEELLDLPNVQLVSRLAFPDAPEVEETGTTFLDNAALKAVQVAQAIHHWVLAEDSGLCVEALDGAPGVFSARYAGEPCDDERNNDKLLAKLTGVPSERRTAYYVCQIVLADDRGNVRATARGTCEGAIAFERRGTGGFGYDPLFLIPHEGKTFGELPSAYKQRVSHRAAAVRALRPQLEDLLRSLEVE